MNHPIAYKTCGIVQLLQALLYFFFLLDTGTPTWVKVLVIITTAIIGIALSAIVGGDDAKMSFLKLLFYIYIIANCVGIVGLLFIDTIPAEGGLISPAQFSLIARSLFFIGGICLPVFAIFAAIALLQLRIKNSLAGFMAILSSVCFGVAYYVTTLPHYFICLPFVLSGIAFLTMKSKTVVRYNN